MIETEHLFVFYEVTDLPERMILHCDLNNFFASVSLLFNPTLKNLPVAVCGDKEQRHGIVLAKNEIAKRYGVQTAEAIFEAKSKCPDLVTLPPLGKEYVRYSQMAQAIYRRYTDLVEPFGIDECWLDVTGSRFLFGDGEHIAEKIRRDIKRELHITVSVGVSFNKVFAKLGSDMKKPDAVTVLSRENFRQKIWGLPISTLLFAGKKTTAKLYSAGIFTIGDVAQCPEGTLIRLLGKNGADLKRYALGEDFSPVMPIDENTKPKSVSRSVTRSKDFTCADSVYQTFLELSEQIADTLRHHELFAAGISVHVRTASLSVKEFTKTYIEPTNSALLLARRGMALFQEHISFSEPLRSVGIGAIHLKNGSCALQEDLFGNFEKQWKQETIENSVYRLRQRFGRTSITRATVVKPQNSRS